MTRAATENPLLGGAGLPQFEAIRPDHVEPAREQLLDALQKELAALEDECEPRWERTLEPVERIADRLDRFWGPVSHLMGVANSDALRAAHDQSQPEVVRFGLRLAQSAPLFAALESLDARSDQLGLSPAQRRIVSTWLRDARLAGAALQGEARERYNQIELELSRLSTEFQNHVLDATARFALTLREPAEVEGLPTSLRALAAEAHGEATGEAASPERGPWRIGLDAPRYIPFMEHSARRELREALYRARVTRASEGEQDNRDRVERILSLRREQAQLLGFESYAQLSLASKMAPDVESARALLEQLREPARAAARRELDELREFAASHGAPEAAELRPWDIPYWAQRQREARFEYTEEELRTYFPLPHVLRGLFGLAETLFDVRIEAADGAAEVWHPDVRFFRVLDAGGDELAAFYLDPYSRPGTKRGGAWMDECLSRSRALGPPGEPARRPVAYLVCNGSPPLGERPSLMTFDEVETLFHEFGHGLQHLLTQVDCGLAAGTRNIEWDAVELPSQFMENWCYHPPTLVALSQHVDTGEPLPEALVRKILAARCYRAGSLVLRQLSFALSDLALHHEYTPGGAEPAFALDRRIVEQNSVLPPLPEDRSLCSFTHIFAGGYAAGYYSYLWAEVLSADAFSAFEEAGLDDPETLREVGRRFRDSVLALGGSCDPMEVFTRFRGRPPRTDALLRHRGLQ